MHSDKHVTLLCPSGFIIIKQTVQISSFTFSAALHYANYTPRTSRPTTINISTAIEHPLLRRKMDLKLRNNSFRVKCVWYYPEKLVVEWWPHVWGRAGPSGADDNRWWSYCSCRRKPYVIIAFSINWTQHLAPSAAETQCVIKIYYINTLNIRLFLTHNEPLILLPSKLLQQWK